MIMIIKMLMMKCIFLSICHWKNNLNLLIIMMTMMMTAMGMMMMMMIMKILLVSL